MSIFLALVFVGCAQARVRPQPVQLDQVGYCDARCFHYPTFDVTVCVTCWERMQRECGRDRDGVWDSGKKRQAGEPVGACFAPASRTIWLDVNNPGSCLHEWCHADEAWSAKTCGKFFNWPDHPIKGKQ